MPSLVTIDSPTKGKEYPLGIECGLGRSFNNDIVIGDLNVSRRHARIVRTEANEYVIEDLGSGNGTFVNDKKIKKHVLCPHDVIRIGGTSFRYEPDHRKAWAHQVVTVVADPMLFPRHKTNIKSVDAEADALVETSFEKVEPMEPLRPKRAQKMLGAMYAVADAIGSELEQNKLLSKILDHLFEVFPQADRGVVLLKDPKTGQLVPEAIKQREGPSKDGFRFSQTIVYQVMEKGKAVMRDDTIPPSYQNGNPLSVHYLADANAENPSLPRGQRIPKMATPLLCSGEVLGTLHLEGKVASTAFTQEDLALLSGIARQAALAIANARAGQELLDQQRLENDLRLARQIQESFLPQNISDIPGLRFCTHYRPALHIGGDFYDIIELDPKRIGLLLGDISGKGVSGALMMAKLTTDIRLLSRTYGSPSEVLTQANRALLATGQDAMFATVIYLLLDLETHTITYANAGHQPPFLLSKQTSDLVELDDATAVALGVVPDTDYPQAIRQLSQGDAVLLYTDGINEALNRQRQEYGIDRLRQVVAQSPPEPSVVIERILSDINRYVGGAPQSDDQTLVAFTFNDS
ncbi:MAG: SpoIIE family protein phosphatase [Pseudomonadota bacterium]